MANGTIAFDTLQTSGQIDGTARSIDTDYLLNGSAKSWVNFEGDNITARDSFNISSLDDDGTGDYGVNFSNGFANDDYEVASAGSNGTAAATSYSLNPMSYATGAVEIEVFSVAASSVAKADRDFSNLTVHGELA